MGFPRERAVVGLGPSGLKEIMLMSIKNGQITYIVGLLFIILKNKYKININTHVMTYCCKKLLNMVENKITGAKLSVAA